MNEGPTVLLTRLLEDALDRSEVSHVVNVSSALHRGGRINWNDLNWKRRYNRSAAYAHSKLALTMMTTALTEFRPKVREAVSVHPGIIATGMLPGYSYSYRGRPVAERSRTGRPARRSWLQSPQQRLLRRSSTCRGGDRRRRSRGRPEAVVAQRTPDPLRQATALKVLPPGTPFPGDDGLVREYRRGDQTPSRL
ncbi:hypothetical protein [Amycolatopsis sp. lyj-90]|uniref:hypothetical protein n=1 Tax=Amycolatopsis sp. lyj-90 TaxID=2789285 RepID=UPI00397DA3B2